MEVIHWFGLHWLDFLQSAGIVGGLLFTAVSLRIDARVRRVSNLLKITENHRELWSRLQQHPELSRVLKPDVDLERNPVTPAEELFVSFVVFHLNGAREAIEKGMLSAPDGLRHDITTFFALPIPKAVWQTIKDFQDKRFVRFVEANSELDFPS